MTFRDAEKTAFKTSIRNFYYTMMHIRLKNMGATYQRTMTAIFHDMMHHEMEDYVDDIVVKSRKREAHVKLLFERYRLFNLRMNLKKCAFRISAEKFLGFLVLSRGIDVDPAKATKIVTIRPLANVKKLSPTLGGSYQA